MKPRLLLAIDRPRSPRHAIAKAIAADLADAYEVTVKPHEDATSGTYEVAVAFWWESLPLLCANVRAGRVVCYLDDASWKADGHRFQWALSRAHVVAVSGSVAAGELPTGVQPVVVATADEWRRCIGGATPEKSPEPAAVPAPKATAATPTPVAATPPPPALPPPRTPPPPMLPPPRARTERRGKPGIYLGIDRWGWAFDNVAARLRRDLDGEFCFTARPYMEPVPGEFDVGVAFWWQSLAGLQGRVKARRWVLCVYDGYSWRASPTYESLFADAVAAADFVAVANEPFLSLLGERVKRPAFVVEDGVDCGFFTPRPLPAAFRVGWAGNPKASRSAAGVDDVKGLGLIKAACRDAGVELVVCDATDRQLRHAEMPGWYGGISAYICASSCEGTPNTVLEAAACGRPSITTDVGLLRRVVTHGVSGMFVERSAGAIAGAIRELSDKPRDELERMGRLARLAVEAHDWRLKIPAWRSCLHAAAEA